jgi:hypothetical protein
MVQTFAFERVHNNLPVVHNNNLVKLKLYINLNLLYLRL